jgi:hypothetical protein
VITPLVLMLMGVVVVGLNLGRMVSVSQVARDAASMYVRGVDFSKAGNKDIIVRLAHGLGLTRDGGQGVVILSKVTWISEQQCEELEDGACNADRHVITQRILIGNASLRTSALGTPNPGLLDSLGQVRDYIKEPSAVANFPFAQLSRGEFAFVAEAYFVSPNLGLPGFQSGDGVYARAIF